MIAVAWAAIGLTTVTVGLLAAALFRLEARFDARFDRMDEKLDAHRAETNARFDRMDQRLDNLSMQFAEHLRRHAS
ncbi:MAG: hypothetical protein ACRDKB_05390 [Actinomycetota bacterium]